MGNRISEIEDRLKEIEDLIAKSGYEGKDTLRQWLENYKKAVQEYIAFEKNEIDKEWRTLDLRKDVFNREKESFKNEKESFENEKKRWANLPESDKKYRHIYPSICCELNDHFFVSSCSYSERKMYLKFENCFEEFWKNYSGEKLDKMVEYFKNYSKDHPEKIQKNFKIKEENLLRIMRIGKRYELNIGQVISLAIYSLYHS